MGISWKSTLLVAFVLLRSTDCVVAAERCRDSATCLQAIETAQASTHSLSARFTQTKHISLMNEPIVTHGHFAFRRPQCAASATPSARSDSSRDGKQDPSCAPQVVWKLEQPTMTIRIGPDGVQLPPEVEREAGAGLKAITGALEQVGALMSGSLAGVTRLFEVEAKPAPDGVIVHLVPRNTSVKDLFAAIDMHFQGEHLILHSIRIAESLGDRLEIGFHEIHRNDAQAEAAARE